jgi:predicted nuclease of predicted toxin-antitoxin system
VRFVLDAQLPPVLARALREAGYDVWAVRELGLRDAEDSDIWDYALANQAAIISKDQDFAEWLMSSRTAPVIVWLRIGNTSNRALLAWLLPLWPDIISRIESGDNLVEVREKRSLQAPDG